MQSMISFTPHNRTPTSRAAALSAQPKAGTQAARVLETRVTRWGRAGRVLEAVR